MRCLMLLLLAVATSFGADRYWLTIYDHNYAVVRDIRSFTLSEGTNEICFTDISPMILDAPVRVSGDKIVAREQTFEYHRLNNDMLLNDNLEKKIELILNDSIHTVVAGQLLGRPPRGENGLFFIQLADGSTRTVRAAEIGDFRYPTLPQQYRIKPALTFTIECSAAGTRNVEAAYEVQGLDWGARYLLDLSDNDSIAVFSGWAIISNATGRAFNHTRITLVSGQPPNTTRKLRLTTDERIAATERRVTNIAGLLKKQPGFKGDSEGAMNIHGGRADEMLMMYTTHEQLFDLQTYTLPDETSLSDGVEKEVNLFAPTTIKTSASYEYAWWQDYNKVGVYVETINTDSVGMGVPLPPGPVVVYRMRAGNVPEYVGENRIAATAVNEPLRIRVGSAEGLVVKRTLLKEEVRSSSKKDNTWEVRLKNEREEDVDVKIQDRFTDNWKILSSSEPYSEVANNMIVFPVMIPAGDEVVLTYETRTWTSWKRDR